MIIKNALVYTEDHKFEKKDVRIEDERIVEIAEKNELYNNPQHPYTKALLSAIPIPDVDNKMKREILTGDVPSPLNPPSGCYFHTRCKYATERCKTECPALHDVGNGHMVACHLT